MKLFLIIVVLSTSIFAKSYKQFASEFKYETNYKIALEKAKIEKKDIMFVMTANFCPWCSKFIKRVLSKKEINKNIHKKFIPLILNREEHKFPKTYNTPFIPVVYIVDYKTNEIKNKIVGYSNRFKFIRLVNE
jgi:thioredoxin-related protein